LGLLKLIIFQNRDYRKLYLHPEKNWSEALRIHPAIQPSKLVKLLQRHKFSIISRQSSLWFVKENGILYRFLLFIEQHTPFFSAFYWYHLCTCLDSLLNLIPIFRIFESRCIILAHKNQLPDNL
jgi:hypothetical protein